ncbi:MAG: DUF2147 domain-containing protein [Desulfobacterales bacterium]|nr:DUF2147 domain-containing protein [Desulfobacterales bacterium]
MRYAQHARKIRKDKPLMGLLVLWDLKKEAGRYVEGKVYDVDEGKEYKCSYGAGVPGQS